MQITINGMTDNLQNVQEINFDDAETKVVVNAKLFLDINENIEDLKINLKYLEQDVKNKFLEKKKEIILDAAKLVEEQQTILRNHFERNLISELEKCKNQAVKDTIQLLYVTTIHRSCFRTSRSLCLDWGGRSRYGDVFLVRIRILYVRTN